MQNQYTYTIILAASLAGPLLLSFDKKVAFYKNWKYLFPAMIIPAIIYIVWDAFFTAINVWGFNEKFYIQSLKIFNLPLEEVLFFFVVPYCCMFIYECIKSYFPNIQHQQWGKPVLNFIAYPLLIVAVIYYQRYYTAFTFIGLALFIYAITYTKKIFKNFNASLFLVSYAVCLIPFLVVNGFLTAIPVVKYNHYQNLNIRIHTIPVEDIFYGMLLIMMNVAIYERLKSKKPNGYTNSLV